MNKTYRLVWNEARQDWIVASEGAATRGKRSSTRKRLLGALVGALIVQPAVAAGPAPTALPTGGQVVAGQAAISQAGTAMTVQQASDKAILNWQSFNIGSQASVRFQQPSGSSVALNRVVGADPSALYGSLTANGQVFLVNPNGVLFGQGARVDVGGLVASTLGIRNEDFLSGNYRFTRDGSGASVINQGDLAARYVALLSAQVTNEGVIAAPMGTVALASGEAVTLGITGRNLVSVQVDPATIDTLVENKRLIKADAGTVIIAAKSASQLLGKVVNTGAVEAQGLINDGGVIRLTASSSIDQTGSLNADAGAHGNGGHITVIADLDNPDSRTNVSGAISARGGAASGNGGFVETSGSQLTIADSARIDTSAANGRAGQWLLDPFDFTIGAANGDITGTALGTALGSGNVTIATTNSSVSCTGATCGTGTSSGNGDINVNDSVTWGTANKLTLSAWRNININAPINVNLSGGGLALEYGQSDPTANVPPATYFVNAPVSLAAGATFSTKIGSTGPTVPYTVIRDNAGLVAIGLDLAGKYVLGTDFTATTNPWVPLGNGGGDITTATGFTGILDGLGHKIDGLTRANTTNSTGVGLFGSLGDGLGGGTVQNLGLTNVSLAGLASVGALGGLNNNGTVYNVYATGTVTGSDTAGAVNTVRAIGGLIGENAGNIGNSYAAVNVTATGGAQTLGGGTDGGVGGLVGIQSAGAISISYATGSVAGVIDVGGLVGNMSSTSGVTSTYATGAVSGTTNVGGLVGQLMPGAFAPVIMNSYWDTATTGQDDTKVGTGVTVLVGPPLGGENASNYAGFDTAGMKTASNLNLDFVTSWIIYEGVSYPLLRSMLIPIYVIADNKSATYTGNPFAAFTSTISPSVPGTAYTGAVNYMPSTANPTNAGGYTVMPGGVSLTAPTDQQGYRTEATPGTLTIGKAHLTVTADNQARLYGEANPNFTQTLSGFVNGETLGTSGVTGAATAFGSSTATPTTAVGASPVIITASAAGLGAANYDFPTLVNGALTINKAHLTVTADNQARLYGQANPIFTQTLSGFVNGETLGTSGVTGAATAFGTSTATALTNVSASPVTITASAAGLGADNYDFPTLVNGALTISKAHLTVTADNQVRLYGQANPNFTQVLSGFVNGETLATSGVTGAATAFGTSTATGTTSVGASPVTITASATGLGAANYDFPTLVNGLLTINKAHLTVTADNQARLYGQANPNFTQTLSGFVNGETVGTSGVTGAATAFGTSTATATTSVSASPVAITASAAGFGAVNYDFPTLVNGALTINKAHLTVTADNKNMVAGATLPALTTTLSGFVNSESLATSGVTGSGAASTTATSTSPAGNVSIVAALGTLAAANYDFPTLVNGTLQITAPTTSTPSTSNDATSQKANAAITTVTKSESKETKETSRTQGPNAPASPSAGSNPVTGADKAMGNSENSGSTSRTDAPPSQVMAARTSNPTPKPGETVPISAPAAPGGAPVLDSSKPASAVLLPADGGADIPIPPPKITQNANGSVAVEVTVPPDTPAGVYLVSVVGTDAKGVSRAIIVPVVVRTPRRAT